MDNKTLLQQTKEEIDKAVSVNDTQGIYKLFEDVVNIMEKQKEEISKEFGVSSREMNATKEVDSTVLGTLVDLVTEMKRSNDMLQIKLSKPTRQEIHQNKSKKMFQNFKTSIQKAGNAISEKATTTWEAIKGTAIATRDNVNQFAQDRKTDVLKAADKAIVNQLDIKKSFHRTMENIHTKVAEKLTELSNGFNERAMVKAEHEVYAEVNRQARLNMFRFSKNRANIELLRKALLEDIEAESGFGDKLLKMAEKENKIASSHTDTIRDINFTIDEKEDYWEKQGHSLKERPKSFDEQMKATCEPIREDEQLQPIREEQEIDKDDILSVMAAKNKDTEKITKDIEKTTDELEL